MMARLTQNEQKFFGCWVSISRNQIGMKCNRLDDGTNASGWQIKAYTELMSYK